LPRKCDLEHEKRDHMRILLVSEFFPPERGPTGHMFYELGADLAQRGHQITVITGFPNHPYGEIFGGYRKRLWQVENIKGMRVIRVWLFTSPNRRTLSRIMTFLTFTITSSLAILLAGRQNIMFAVLQPLSVGLIYPIFGMLTKTKVVFNLQDLHPDAAIDAGLVSNRLFIKVLRTAEVWSYRLADHICAICNVFREHVISKGISPSKVSVIYNWIDVDEIRPLPRVNKFRSRIGLASDDFVVLYAGNIGYSSGADIILKVAKCLQRRAEIKFLFIGEGPAKDKLQKFSRKEDLSNVLFFPFQPRDAVPFVQATSDVSLVIMQPGWAKKSVGFSSKVLAYMAAARPVVASVDLDSEMAQLVKEAQCGLVTPAGDAQALASGISSLFESPDLRATLGANGRKYVERHFSRPVITEKHLSLFQTVSMDGRQKNR